MIGIAIAAPVGPIGMLCIKKTLEVGFRGALLVGLGAAFADAAFGAIATCAVSEIFKILVSNAQTIKLLGGVFLLYLAYREAKQTTASSEATVKSKTQLKLVAEIFFLTMTNPMTILSFIGIFASISNGPASGLESVAMVVGIFLGSMMWWCILGATITKMKHRLPMTWIEGIKRISCLILAGFGIFSVVSSLTQ
ncbi:MAG: LysE family translocator [Methylocystaceae bacterium]|nr:LysE family translocator [Methylocystaceae bacterium]